MVAHKVIIIEILDHMLFKYRNNLKVLFLISFLSSQHVLQQLQGLSLSFSGSINEPLKLLIVKGQSVCTMITHKNHKDGEPMDEGPFEIVEKVGYETFKVLLGNGICATFPSCNLVPCFPD